MDDDPSPPLRTAEKLDVEGEEERRVRIQSTLEKLNMTSTSTNKTATFPTLPSFDFGKRPMHEIQPPSELLSRVQAFLPELEASNNLLVQKAQADPNSVDIEHVDEGMDQYIEMNLGLGVFEDRANRQKYEDEDTEMSSSSESTELEDDSSDVDTDSSSEIITSFHPIRPIKPLPRRRSDRTHPHIVVLGGQSQA
ncbi:hypothetical protein BDZ94DRAFT_1270012 [Collybia nuda]|uniref:Uncharacterized protein n=1 Tax=Collybia nuda TaxID=64659 RepID=A0A9P5XZV2_9AGAR|nr:hypothetical protein BDZ94DRAFT_1270012 [Collybia nuda]